MARHQFGRPRVVSDALTLSASSRSHSSKKFHDLPQPTGAFPYELALADILPAGRIRAMERAKKMVFHVGGDAGGIREATPQQLVADGMERDFMNDPRHPEDDPAFLYLLGDCVYYNGEAAQYYPQFYQPYENYLAPIFAVPGNHDGENVPPEKSLEAFVRNFCAKKPQITPDAGDSTRTAMTQPNVFWTLLTPLCTIIGLYTNVPEGGQMNPDQIEWLGEELKRAAKKDLPIFIAMHHPPYSADTFHSGSEAMKDAISEASKKARRAPDVVLAGHVHAYERFSVPDDKGVTPYVVAGGLGYYHLHTMVKVNGQKIVPPVEIEGVTLENYVDTRHGFLRIEVTSEMVQGKYYTVARPHESWSEPPHLVDLWQFDWRKHKLIPNRLPQGNVVIDSSIAAIREPRLRRC
jgi:acid phosphatase type 7